MKAGAGKGKGGAFEREVCRRLSLWLSCGRRSDLLWRSAMSGGRATVQFRAGKVNLVQSGDVSAVGHEAYEFCEKTFVECKHYKDLSIARGFVCETGLLAEFWRKASDEAAKYGKRPFLVARQNLYPTLAIVDASGGIFDETPMIVLHRWDAHVYLFDEVTAVRARLVRRAG